MALDPAEQHLRHVEKDVLIPKIMREKARERCSEQVEDFTRCCKDSGILMVVKCRKENSALKDCLTAYNKENSVTVLSLQPHQRPEKDIILPEKTRSAEQTTSKAIETTETAGCLDSHPSYNDPAFYEECKLEYLKEREEFRKTGVPTKKRLQRLPTSM